MTTETFYEQIVGFTEFEQFTEVEQYQPLPDDWFVVITDVVDSTKAIEAGRYRAVNALGAASIVAVLNAVAPLKIPYVFGGDGATLCVPSSAKDEVMGALAASTKMALTAFGFDLRVGMVPMQVIQENGREILISKYAPSDHYQQAMFLGDGLGYAESLIKDPGSDNPYLIPDEIAPDGSFDGFECRWNEIPSPYEETVAILVQELEGDKGVYAEVSRKIIEIYGRSDRHHPLRLNNLSLSFSPNTLMGEARIRTAFQSTWARWRYRVRLLGAVALGKWFMSRGVKTETTDWGRYKPTMIANSDYRKFDELLRMLISGTAVQRQELRTYLEKLRQDGKIVYGIHANSSALMTCLIFNYDPDHVHFLDGSDGGYALAAKELKQQLKNRYAHNAA